MCVHRLQFSHRRYQLAAGDAKRSRVARRLQAAPTDPLPTFNFVSSSSPRLLLCRLSRALSLPARCLFPLSVLYIARSLSLVLLCDFVWSKLSYYSTRLPADFWFVFLPPFFTLLALFQPSFHFHVLAFFSPFMFISLEKKKIRDSESLFSFWRILKYYYNPRPIVSGQVSDGTAGTHALQ